MMTSILLLAALALAAPRTIVGQECTSFGRCKGCAQAGCVWAQETKECLSSCPWTPGITCTFGDASVCKLGLGGTGDDSNDGLSSGAIAGLAIGVTLLLLIILLCCCCKKSPAPPIQAKEDTTVMSNPGLGSHNSHKIDVHRCQSANCMECGGKLESPIKFIAADETLDETMDEEEDASQNEDMMEDVETFDF